MPASTSGAGVRAVDVFAEFEKNLVPFKKLVHEAIDQVASERTCTHCLAHEGVDAAVRSAVRVLLTGAAGFIGGRVCAALRADGHEVVAVDAHARRRARLGAELPDGLSPGRRPRRRRAGAAARRCRRGVPSGRRRGCRASTPPTRRPTPATTTTAQRYCWREMFAGRMSAAGAGVVDGGLRAGRLRRARCTVSSTRCRAPAPISTPACSSTAARSAVRNWRGGWSARTRRCGRAACTRRARPRRSTTRWRGRSPTGGSVVALRYHNVYGPGMPRDTPYSGVAAIFRSSLERGEAPRVFEDGGQMRDFVHVDDVAAANVAAVGSELGGFLPRSTSARAGRSRSWRSPPGCARPAGDRRPWSPGSTAAATSATSSPTRRRRPRSLGFRATIDPLDGLRRVRVRPAAGVTAWTSNRRGILAG